MTNEKTMADRIEHIRYLRSLGTPDTMIRDQMHISDPSFWRAVKNMKRIDRQVMEQKFTDDVSSEVRMFETRLMRDIMACEAIISNREIDPIVKLDAIRLKTDLGVIMIKMYREGPRILNVNTLEQKEQAIGLNRPVEQPKLIPITRQSQPQQEATTTTAAVEVEEQYNTRPSDTAVF